MPNKPTIPVIHLQVRDIVAHACYQALVNRTPLTRIVLMDGHKVVPIDRKQIRNFLMTGLSNLDFFHTGYGVELDYSEYDKLSKTLDFDSCKEAERADLEEFGNAE